MNTSNPAPLDPALYELFPAEAAFFKLCTGLHTDEELQGHILAIQSEAYHKVFPYPCIRLFAFTSLKLPRYPIYPHLLRIGRERPDAILLDIGCCLGTDVRKAIQDGYPAQNVITSDLRKEFWALGHKLFRIDPATDPVQFIHGDILEVDPAPPADVTALARNETPPKSLTDLYARCSAIHISYLFHAFSETQQARLARILAALLLPRAGCIIFGAQFGMAEAGERVNAVGYRSFAHSPESWRAMWCGVGGVFESGSVECDAKLVEPAPRDAIPKGGDGQEVWLLIWSIKRR